MNRTVDMTSD
uniref:Uncharacterized protein n=1 Tax=Arundo donax TaxID=35708 RepID=A0A0A9AG91_ARUDO